MNTIMPSATYGTSRTTGHLTDWLFSQVASVPHTQPQTTVSTKQQATFHIAIGTTLTAMFVGLSPAGHIEPPTLVQTTKYTAPVRTFLSKENGALNGYQIVLLQNEAISEYLRQYPNSRDFLRGVAAIVDDIYGLEVVRTIDMIDDVDTGTPIMKLTIQSGLPLNDEFDQKDQLLFKRIEVSGLAWGLRDVVISQG